MTRPDLSCLPPYVEPCRSTESLLGGAPERSRAISAFAAHEPLGRAAVDLLAALRETDGDLGRTLDARADLGDALADAAARLRAYATVKREDRAAISSSTALLSDWLDQVKALAAEIGGATVAFPADPVKAADRLRQAHRAQVDRLRAEISRLGSELERTAKEDARLRSAAEVEAKLERHTEIRALLRYLEHGGSGEGVPYLPAAQQIRRRIETAEARIAELEARPDGREVARRAAEIAGLVGDLPAEQDPAAWLGEGVKREIARQQEAVAEEVRRALAYVDVGGDPSPLRCRVQAEAIRRKLCALVGAQVEAEAALAGAREALRNATERADAIREAAVRDAVRAAVSAVRDYDSYSGPMADDVAALADDRASRAEQIRELSAEVREAGEEAGRLRAYATELEGVAADLRRELAASRESVAELSDALDRARADLELAERSRALQVGDRCRLRGPGPIWSGGEAVEIEQVSASAMVRFDSGGRLRVSADELERLAPTAPPTAGATAPVSPALPLGPKKPPRLLPRVAAWTELRPGDLAWDGLAPEDCRGLYVVLSHEHYAFVWPDGRVEVDNGRPLSAYSEECVLLGGGMSDNPLKIAAPALETWSRLSAEAEALAAGLRLGPPVAEVLPRAVDWTAAHRPGDLLWDAAALSSESSSLVLVRVDGLLQWRVPDGFGISDPASAADLVRDSAPPVALRAVLVARGVGSTPAEVLAAWRAAEPAARALVGLPEDGPPEEALPRVVEWRDLKPGDLALDPDYSAIVWRQERGRGTWRYNDGRRGAGAKTPSALGRAILLARGVPKRASAIREAYERQRAAAEALADEARRVR